MRAGAVLLACFAATAGLVLAVRPGHAPRPNAVHATISPSTPRFGDLVTATIEVPHGARVHATFTPFEVVRTRHAADAWTFTLRCVAVGCLTRGENQRAQLPSATVTLGGRKAFVQWPAVTLGSRLDAADLARPSLRADTTPPPVRYRVDPVVLGWTLAGLAAALVLAGGAAGAVLLRRRAPLLHLVPQGRELTPLEQALAALERSLGEPVERRRVALDGLALQLQLLDAGPLALRVRGLGWSPRRPEQAEIRKLLDACRGVQAA